MLVDAGTLVGVAVGVLVGVGVGVLVGVGVGVFVGVGVGVFVGVGVGVFVGVGVGVFVGVGVGVFVGVGVGVFVGVGVGVFVGGAIRTPSPSSPWAEARTGRSGVDRGERPIQPRKTAVATARIQPVRVVMGPSSSLRTSGPPCPIPGGAGQTAASRWIQNVEAVLYP